MAPPAVTPMIPSIIEDILRPIFKHIVLFELLRACKLVIMSIPLLQLHFLILLQLLCDVVEVYEAAIPSSTHAMSTDL